MPPLHKIIQQIKIMVFDWGCANYSILNILSTNIHRIKPFHRKLNRKDDPGNESESMRTA